MKKWLPSFLMFFLLQYAYCQEIKDVFNIARKGTREQIQEFFKSNPNAINSVDSNGFTALILACYKGNNEVAKFLIENGCDVNYKSEMGTALMAASVKGNVEMINILLDKKADINGIDYNGLTALMLAVKFGNEQVIHVLLQNKADKTKIDTQGKTAFEYAVLSGNEEIITLLK